MEDSGNCSSFKTSAECEVCRKYDVSSGNIYFDSYFQQTSPAPFTWTLRLDGRKVRAEEVERMRRMVRPWLEMSETGSERSAGLTVFTLRATTLGRLSTGHCNHTDDSSN